MQFTSYCLSFSYRFVFCAEALNLSCFQSGPVKKAQKTVTQYSHIFFVSVRNFVCKMNEDAELLMTLYDAKEGRAITENYVVRWSKEGLAQDIDQLHNLRVLFTVS